MNRFLLSSVFISSLTFAYSDFVPLRERAQAHSLTGALQANESVYSNPAGATFYNTYTVEGTYAFPRSFSASVIDTKTTSVGAGLGYFKNQDLETQQSQQGFRLILGTRLTENLGVALAGKAIWNNRPGQTSQSKDADAGLLWKYGFSSAGLVIRNILGGSDINQRRELSLGGRLGYENTLFVSASMHSEFSRLSPYEVGIGAEYISPWHFALMGGYRFETENEASYWSTGVSFFSPRMSLHYAIEFPQQPNESSNHLLGLSLEM